MVPPLVLYTDDPSGSRSGKCSKFDLWCLKFAGLPWKVNSQLHNIHFLGCSNQVSALEMAAPLVDDLLKLENVCVCVGRGGTLMPTFKRRYLLWLLLSAYLLTSLGTRSYATTKEVQQDCIAEMAILLCQP